MSSGASKKKRKTVSNPEQLSKSQLKALEVRQAETVPAAVEPTPVVTTPDAASPSARRRRSAERVYRRPVSLSREHEYAIIRSDMRRLLLIAGSLLVAMLGMLLVIE